MYNLRALIYDWTEKSTYVNKADIKESFRNLGIDYDAFLFDFKEKNVDELLLYFKKINAKKYDFCFSINYFPEISVACMKWNLKYISWGYDCPFNVKNIEDTLDNSCNYVFCFDRNQVIGYANKGFDNIFHLPLGVNVNRYKKINVSNKQLELYKGDISFIGSLYEGDYSGIKELCDEYHKGYLEAIINSQLQLYGAYILNDAITDSFVEEMNQHFVELQSDTKFRLTKEQVVHVLDQETSRRERLILLSLLSKKFDSHLYSYQKYELLNNMHQHGTVDYMTEMPYVFAASKINLNISVKGIQTGMPQRTLDVMASGGFLLSNYQQELVEYFSEGEEMAVYTSIEDALEKCYFYLQNDELRKQIALNGREKVFAEHNMLDKITAMINTAKI